MKISQDIITRRTAAFEDACRHAGLPRTAQRVAVFGYLAQRTTHPSAQTIYRELKQTMPHISLATIYKNLDKLIELGVIRKLILQDGTARFDAEMSEHHHIINLDTSEISDLHTDLSLPLPRSLSPLRLEAVSVHYYVRN